MTGSSGNDAQVRIVADQVAGIAIERFAAEHPELRSPQIPTPLRWAGMIMAAVFTLGLAGMAMWLVSTVSTMQVTLARMDERMASQGTSQDARFTDMERRVGALEARVDGRADGVKK